MFVISIFFSYYTIVLYNMNLQEYLEYRIECPLCKKGLETYFHFTLEKPSGLVITYQVHNNKLVKNTHPFIFNKGIWDGFPKTTSISEVFDGFRQRKRVSTLHIETICPGRKHYAHSTKRVHPNIYYRYINYDRLNSLEILFETVRIEDYTISNSFRDVYHPTTEIWHTNNKHIFLPLIPITSWKSANIQEQIDKYLIPQ